uniref:KDGP aldolase n=1 Tax=Bacillus sp. S1-R5C1-FB TaxID=1973491 RepID=UPI000B48C80F
KDRLVASKRKVGHVNLPHGPIRAAREEKEIVPIKTAIAVVRDMGGNSLKYFPMNGLAHEEEYRAVAKACAEEGFALEPTGGIDKEHFETILRIALAANVEQVIPHVYSSIIDKETGNTKVEDVRELLAVGKKLVDQYA